jgi:hypothetical protein
MKRMVVMLTLIVMISTLFPASIQSASAFPASKAGVGILTKYDVNSPDKITYAPGSYVELGVGIYKPRLADEIRFRSVDITISYDENVFEASDDLLRYDEALNKYVWRDDMFTQNIEWSEAGRTEDGRGFWFGLRPFKEFKVTNPYPLDVDPRDGRKEIRFTAEVTSDRLFKTLSSDLDEFLYLKLKVKEDSPQRRTAITVVLKQTVLKDSKGNNVDDFYYKSAHFIIEKPQYLAITRPTLDPVDDPFVYHLGAQAFVKAREYFSNGDYVYDVHGTWSSSDNNVAIVKPNGQVVLVGLGNATIIFTKDGLKAEKQIQVVDDSVPLPALPGKYPRGYMWKDPYVDDVQIFINGEDAGLARLMEGSLYAPIKNIAYIVGVNLGHDSANNAPTLDGKMVNYKVVGRNTYLKLADLRSLISARLQYDSAKKQLIINK